FTSHISCCISFFFPLPADPRYSHSFPTRRSSDLILRHPEFRKSDVGAIQIGEQIEQNYKRLYAPDDLLSQGGDLHRRERHEILRDRKSTRLNSSHLVISYAVFCLKKKKIK